MLAKRSKAIEGPDEKLDISVSGSESGMYGEDVRWLVLEVLALFFIFGSGSSCYEGLSWKT